MPRFNLKHLFVAVTLVAIYCAMLRCGWLTREDRTRWFFVTTAPMVGICYGLLFNRLLIGGLIGMVMGIILMLVADVLQTGVRY